MLSFLIGLLLLAACEVGPKPINYGSDSCDYCSMTIVDRQHAAEIVTEKGKVFKFDAIECMVNYEKELLQSPVALHLVADFDEPGELIDATKAFYLKSKELSSPMGANLSAFSTLEAAEEKLESYGGEIYTWNELRSLKEVMAILR